MNVNDIDLFLNEVFPAENALDYDNVGLIAGDRNKIVSAILVSLDLTDKAIEAAKAAGANIVGAVDASEYTFDDSEAVIDGKFVGLALDNDNEDDKTAGRIDAWIAAITPAL